MEKLYNHTCFLESLTDEALVSSYINGDTTALNVLCKRIRPQIFSWVSQRVIDYDASQDYVQDILVKVIRNIDNGKYNEKGKFKSWLRRITENLVGDDIRHKRRMKIDYVLPVEDAYITKSYNEEISFKEEDYSVLNDLVSTLPKPQRDIIKYRYFDCLSFIEISKNLDISINTALGRCRYAILNLKKIKSKLDCYVSV